MLFFSLFRKVDPSCAYCRHGRRISERDVVCLKHGIVPVEHHCRAFRYDPLKRTPPRPALLRLGGLGQEDFMLDAVPGQESLFAGLDGADSGTDTGTDSVLNSGMDTGTLDGGMDTGKDDTSDVGMDTADQSASPAELEREPEDGTPSEDPEAAEDEIRRTEGAEEAAPGNPEEPEGEPAPDTAPNHTEEPSGAGRGRGSVKVKVRKIRR